MKNIGPYVKSITGLLLALVTAGILLGGCVRQTYCDVPYVQIGYKCCLDSNNNSVCEEDEILAVNTSPQMNQTPQNNTPANFTNKTAEPGNNTSAIMESDFFEFYGGDCIHCKRMVPVVSHVENETGVNFTKLEIWYNQTNHELFTKYEDKVVRDCGFSGVPAFINIRTNRAICGEMVASDLKQFVKENSNPGK